MRTRASSLRRRSIAVGAVAAGLLLAAPLAAHAATEYEPESIAFDDLGPWIQDRAAPSDYEVTDSSLTIEIVAAESHPSDNFRRTEGIKAPVSGHDGLQAQLAIDPAWEGVESVRAGLWLVVPPNEGSTKTTNEWPLLEFTNVDDEPVLRYWDPFDVPDGAWYTIDEVDVEYGESYTLGTTLNPGTGAWDYLVDGEVVGSVDSEDYTTQPVQVIFNSYNSGDADYTVVWENLAGLPGTEVEPEPEPEPTKPPTGTPTETTTPPSPATPPTTPATSPDDVPVPTSLPVIPTDSDVLDEGEPAVTPPSPPATEPGEPTSIVLGPQWAYTWQYVVVYSEPTVVGWVQADGDGRITFSLPASLPAGAHTIALFDENGDLVSATELEVLALAVTGAEISPLAIAAGGTLLLAGAAVLVVAAVRRRRLGER